MKNATSPICFIWQGWGGGLHSTLNCEIHYLCKFMQIYSSVKNATSLFRSGFWFCLFYLIGMGGASKLLHLNADSGGSMNAKSHYLNAYKRLSGSLATFWLKIPSLFYLIGIFESAFQNGGGFKTSTLNCEIHYLCKFMQIYSKSMKNATSPICCGIAP